MFTPLVGVPMENSLDLVIVWAIYGTYMCRTFWPIPSMQHLQANATSEPQAIKWPKKAHPGALDRGRPRTPRCGLLAGRVPHSSKVCFVSVYHTWKALAKPSPCQVSTCFSQVASLPIACGRSYSIAFGRAKNDAPEVLNQLAQLGWETLPIALLGMPHYPAPVGSRHLETDRRVFVIQGAQWLLQVNSALRFLPV